MARKFEDEGVREVFAEYPARTRKDLMKLRAKIFASAKKSNVDDLEETLKWGQPSYVCKSGSTFRIDQHGPHTVAAYFHCQTKLVRTFKALYDDVFEFEGNRAIVFQIGEAIPKELDECFAMALRYHQVKKLPLLGAIS